MVDGSDGNVKGWGILNRRSRSETKAGIFYRRLGIFGFPVEFCSLFLTRSPRENDGSAWHSNGKSSQWHDVIQNQSVPTGVREYPIKHRGIPAEECAEDGKRSSHN